MSGTPTPASQAPLRVGGVFPLTGSAASLAAQEQLGVRIALEAFNQDGGLGGRQVVLDTQDLEAADDAQAAVDALRDRGDVAVIGAYSSDLSIPASAAAARDHMVYWEAGAVADQLTGQGLPLVFRVGATGSDLGGNSLRFVVDQIAPRLGRPPSTLRVALVTADDVYAHSVADAARASAAEEEMAVTETVYDPWHPDFTRAIDDIIQSRPDILLLSAHIPDGIAFRHAFVQAHLHVAAFIGTTMAQCYPDFGNDLGQEAVGVFASDRPGDAWGVDVASGPYALAPAQPLAAALDATRLPNAARAVYADFAGRWAREHGGPPTEEGLSGFSAGWALFHYVLPVAARSGHLDPDGIANAARHLDLPEGALPNGAGLLFATDPDHLGQNIRAAATVEQWQASHDPVVVWPPEYATAAPIDIPLPQ